MRQLRQFDLRRSLFSPMIARVTFAPVTSAAVTFAAILLTTNSCSNRVLPARGELLILLSSDMQVPETWDTLILRADTEPPGIRHIYLPAKAAISSWSTKQGESTDATLDCTPHAGDITEPGLLELPTTLAITSRSSDKTATSVKVTACKGDAKVFESDVPIEIPAEGETQLLELPIRWLCADKRPEFAASCFSCGGGSCYGKSIEVDNSATFPCKVPGCETLAAYPSLAYDSQVSARFRPDVTAETGCFDVLGCFPDDERLNASSLNNWAAIADWKTRPNDGATPKGPCVVELDSANTDLDHLNLAIELPAGTFGTCSKTHCLVPLDADSKLGWQTVPGDQNLVTLPDAVCSMLDSGQILSIVRSTKCVAKKLESPVCKSASASSVAEVVQPPATSARALYQFSLSNAAPESTALFERGTGTIDLDYSFEPTTTEEPRAVSGVVGLNQTVAQLGQTFSSRAYAKSTKPFDASAYLDADGYSVSLFASLTEAGFLSEHVSLGMPLLSNLSSDCQSGLRLALEPCTDSGVVRLVLALPTGTAENGECHVDYHSFPFASRSWEWGYYSPWKRGDFRHVVVGLDPSAGPRVYIDSKPVKEARDHCGVARNPTTPSDGSYLYLGTNAKFVGTPAIQSAPIELDEVIAFDRVLSDQEVWRLFAFATTRPGPAGLRWGTWATQGSGAELGVATPRQVPATVQDQAFSSAGLYALVGPQSSLYEPTDVWEADLSEYDEAVISVKFPSELPLGSPFQFALSAEHGLRQCTWQMATSGSGQYVLNLRQPSWCIDPSCGFDFRRVERASLATDWKEAQPGELALELTALAFRKRRMKSTELGTDPSTNTLGRTDASSHLCWRAVSYDPRCLLRLSAYAPDSVGYELLNCDSANSSSIPPELVADFPVTTNPGGRDFSQCGFVRACLKSALPGQQSTFVFELTHELGRTRTWDFTYAGTGDCFVADLSQSGTLWPPSSDPSSVKCSVGATANGGASTGNDCTATDADSIRQNAVRMALKFAASLQLRSLECCASRNDGCVPIGDDFPPTVAATLSR